MWAVKERLLISGKEARTCYYQGKINFGNSCFFQSHHPTSLSYCSHIYKVEVERTYFGWCKRNPLLSLSYFFPVFRMWNSCSHFENVNQSNCHAENLVISWTVLPFFQCVQTWSLFLLLSFFTYISKSIVLIKHRVTVPSITEFTVMCYPATSAWVVFTR